MIRRELPTGMKVVEDSRRHLREDGSSLGAGPAYFLSMVGGEPEA
ncbi:hypothetical protein [Mangrovibacterium marinum]|uniref:Uncharacterized protein n=1 Tax=Mangrovibacterium marinum TaxID=1639118 RepID=A0A2T5C0P5_9BACT|nr:hypothetical protein [Mangrovibacterium marinum]PTN08190.1 hypothetical protein C8N47_11076 [Mangrovibacterium marinum]